ncbi:MAG: 30S ribosomal protein S9 [Planctomycetes bacterium]|nr:30S ribosomal protein S9 [Planctomycetota bacterium]
MAGKEYTWGTGRRKTAVARIRICEGSGNIVVNQRKYDEYFPLLSDQINVLAPLKATETLERYDIYANVRGGGGTGQSGAVLLGIARALIRNDATLESTLRDGGYTTRDSRIKERKKYGQRGARRSFQFSKR